MEDQNFYRKAFNSVAILAALSIIGIGVISYRIFDNNSLVDDLNSRVTANEQYIDKIKKVVGGSECGISEVKYEVAKTYITNYQSKRTALPAHIPKGGNLHNCVATAWFKAASSNTYKNMSGIRTMYGLKKSTDDLAKDRLVIFLPLDSDGKQYKDTQLAGRYVIVLKLPELFHDPCPELCD